MKNPFRLGSGPGIVLWVLVVLLGLGAYFWFRTQNNGARLSQRNLRDLARIARAVEARTDNLEAIAAGLRGSAGGMERDAARELALVVDVTSWESEPRSAAPGRPPTSCHVRPADPQPGRTTLWLHGNGTSACVEHTERVDSTGGSGAGPSSSRSFVVEFDLASLLRPALHSEFFEEVFLTDASGEILLQPGTGGHRLGRLPPPSEESPEAAPPIRNSTVYRSRVGGRDFVVFVQPVDLRLTSPGAAPAGGEDPGGPAMGPTRWKVGGLVDAAEFRSDALALDPGELSILLLLVVSGVLAWPFVRLWTMGTRERVATRDVVLMGASLVLGGGIVAICVFDLAFLWQLQETFDRQLARIGEEMAANVHAETDHALRELDAMSDRFHRTLTVTPSPDTARGIHGCENLGNPDFDYDCLARMEESAPSSGVRPLEHVCLALEPAVPATPKPVRRVASGGPPPTPPGEGGATGPSDGDCASGTDASAGWGIGRHFPYFTMAYWVNPEGFQVAKWSSETSVTPRRSVAHRAYVRRIQEGSEWRWTRSGPGAWEGAPERGYFLDVIRSINTGEILVALSTPYAPEDAPAGRLEGWVAVMTTKLASLDDPVLPPGFGFAVIDAAGDVLFHSNAERGLEANFLAETDDDLELRSAVLARAEGHYSVRYLGRDVRLFTTPIRSSPLTMIVYQEKAYPRTVALETMTIALTLFGAFALLVLLLGLIVLLMHRRPLAWAWPGREQGDEHRVLLLVFAVLAVGGLLQAFALREAPTVDQYLVHVLAGAYLVGVVAIAAVVFVMAQRRAQALFGAGVAVAALLLLLELLRHVEGGLVPRPLSLLAPLVSVLLGGVIVARWLRSQERFATWLNRVPWLDRNLYPLSAFLGLLVLGTLPAAVTFSLVATDHVELLVKHTQLHTIDQLAHRDLRIAREYWAPGERRPARRAALVCRREGLEGCGSAAWPPRPPFDVLVGASFDTCYRPPPLPGAAEQVVEWRCEGEEVERPDLHVWGQAEGSAHDPILHQLLNRFLPFFNEVSVQTRHLYHAHAASPREVAHPLTRPDRDRRHEVSRGWWWSVHDESGEIGRLVRTLEPGHGGRGEPLLLEVGSPRVEFAAYSRVPTGLGVPSSTPWWLGLLAGLWGLFALVRYMARRVFLYDLEPLDAVPVRRLATTPLAEPMVVVSPWSGDRALLTGRQDVTAVDLREERARAGDDTIHPDVDPGSRPLVVDGVDEVMEDPEWSEGVLDWLEQLRSQARPAILLVDRDPLDIVLQEWTGDTGEASAPSAHGGVPGDVPSPGRARPVPHPERWGRVLSSFSTVHASPSPRVQDGGEAPSDGETGSLWSRWSRHPEGSRERNEELLRKECGVSTGLSYVEEKVRTHPNFGDLSDGALIHVIQSAAEGQYRRIWAGLGTEERMTLAQIGDGAVSLPKRRSTLARLMARGLVVRSPDLRIMNRSFARFVGGAVPPAQLAAWEEGGDEGAWQVLRRPMLLVVVATALFLFVTQRSLFDTGLAFLTAAAAGVPSLLRLLGAARGSREP